MVDRWKNKDPKNSTANINTTINDTAGVGCSLAHRICESKLFAFSHDATKESHASGSPFLDKSKRAAGVWEYLTT